MDWYYEKYHARNIKLLFQNRIFFSNVFFIHKPICTIKFCSKSNLCKNLVGQGRTQCGTWRGGFMEFGFHYNLFASPHFGVILRQ